MKRLLFALLLLATVVRADTAGSIYQVAAALADQSGVLRRMDVYQGHPVLVTMFYGSCPMACPLLIDTLRATERAAPASERSQLRLLLISIDPERDTVANLKALGESRKLDPTRWTLARTDAASVRKIAAVLGIQYRKLPDGGYNHSSIVTLLDANGEIQYQSSVLGKADPELLTALDRITQPARAQRQVAEPSVR
ncbi:SCO family protein [Peristeroidobacter agariperforans]|uniref:SCO family protein n=1 Tax=Peristeroidobacter agariperforans TaxID=268404 RepID=UPI00101D78EC|nr:SCO family protein [Peristeroidobacter agariperforans]